MKSEYLEKERAEMTEKIIKAVEEGTAPWMRPWDGRCGPSNGVTGRMYTGINNMLLSLRGINIDNGKDPRWVTFDQAKKKAWQVQKGAKSEHVLLWKPFGVEDEDGNVEIKAVWQRVFYVFHASQVKGMPEYVPPKMNDIELQEKAEKIIKASGAVIFFHGNQPCFMPAYDKIRMTERGYFHTSAGYYSTILHELVHWTGHISRLARQLTYAEEELVAEIGSMFLSAATGIPQTEENFGNDVAYVRSWLSRVKTKDKGNTIFKAAAAANKAVNFLLEKAGMITTKTTVTEQM